VKKADVPAVLVSQTVNMWNALQIARQQRDTGRDEIADVYLMLPSALRRAPCFLCRLTEEWLYEFGDPINRLPGDSIVTGTHMFPPVDRLLDVLLCARQRLSERELKQYIRRLCDPSKHQDVLAEMLPALRLDSTVEGEFEVAGQAEGNHTVDWWIRPIAGPPILLDVKHRIRDLIEGLGRICAGERDADGTAPAPTHDTAILFKSTAAKFKPRDSSKYLQGVWIVTQLMQERSELNDAFGGIDSYRLHFAIINNWGQEAYILARESTHVRELESLFHLRLSERLVFSRS
jgi:hypothetical protein